MTLAAVTVIYIVLCTDRDIHNSNFIADESGTQAQFLDKLVHIRVENFSKFENVSGNAASSACMMSVIMMDEVS
jgi:hypothetical protein